MRAYPVLVAALCALGGTPALSADAAAKQTDAETELTDRDCAVWVALGREEFHWGQAAADKQQFEVFFKPSAKGGYVEQCPWARYAITPPPIDSYDPNATTGFTTPVYQNGGATVSIITSIRWGDGWGLNTKRCTLNNALGHWIVQRCEAGPLT